MRTLVTRASGLLGLEVVIGKRMQFEYTDKNGEGDHICYISDLTKIRSHYPKWDITRNLENVFEEIWLAMTERACSVGQAA